MSVARPAFAVILALALTGALSAQEGSAIDAPQPDYDAEIPNVITGVVFEDTNRNGVRDAGESGVPGVSVTDGFTVAATDDAGEYQLSPSADAIFITLTRPSGYDVVGAWYQPLAARMDFPVAASANSEDTFTFIHLTDNHLSDLAASHEGLERFVREVNALDPPPAFVFNTGDLVNCSKQLTTPVDVAERYFDTYVEIMSGLRVPWYNVAGDHSDVGYRMEQFPRTDFRCGKAMYWEHLGPHYFSFEYGNLHIVSIDAVYKGGTDKEYNEKTWGRETMLPEHLAWLEADLANRTPGTIVLTGSENPLDDFIPGFAEMGVRLQLVGDTHVVSYQESPVPARAGGALSGTWWNGPCADLSPQGYMIYRAEGDQLDCFYKGLGRQVEVVAPGFGEHVSGAVRIRAHLAQGDIAQPLECRIGDGDWLPMQRAEDAFYRQTWEATLDSAALPDGVAPLTVRSVDGAEERTVPLVIDNGGAAPAGVPAATLIVEPARVMGVSGLPEAPVRVLLNGAPVATVDSQQRYEIAVSSESLRRVNHLRFEFGEAGMGMTVREPHLVVGETTLFDPRQAAIRAVRVKHWGEEIADRAGAWVGEGHQTSFAIRQDEFCFVLPASTNAE